MSSSTQICSNFVLGAPPGELDSVVNDIKALKSDDEPDIIEKLKPAFEKYNEEQLTTITLPGSKHSVLISSHNRLDSENTHEYFDTTSHQSFTFDHLTQKPSNLESYHVSYAYTKLVESLNTALGQHFEEHYPQTSSNAYLVCPSSITDDTIAILISTLRSSPSNFLSAKWRTQILYNTSTSTLSGTISVTVHYYEDGNVALSTSKTIPTGTEIPSLSTSPSAAPDANAKAVIAKVAALEKQYQEEINRTFVSMNEQGFRGLRRQLPVTRQKVEWEKVRGYNLSDNLKGARES